MRKIVTSLGFAAIFAALGRFLLSRLFSAGHPYSAIEILLAASLFTVAIAAVVRE